MAQGTLNAGSIHMLKKCAHRWGCAALKADHNVGLVQARVDGEAFRGKNCIDVADKCRFLAPSVAHGTATSSA